ncbi:unnamed protein product, partial [Tetraodon nigroviridis]
LKSCVLHRRTSEEPDLKANLRRRSLSRHIPHDCRSRVQAGGGCPHRRDLGTRLGLPPARAAEPRFSPATPGGSKEKEESLTARLAATAAYFRHWRPFLFRFLP